MRFCALRRCWTQRRSGWWTGMTGGRSPSYLQVYLGCGCSAVIWWDANDGCRDSGWSMRGLQQRWTCHDSKYWRRSGAWSSSKMSKDSALAISLHLAPTELDVHPQGYKSFVCLLSSDQLPVNPLDPLRYLWQSAAPAPSSSFSGVYSLMLHWDIRKNSFFARVSERLQWT